MPNDENTPATRPIKAYITAVSPEAPLNISASAAVIEHMEPESVPPYFAAVRISVMLNICPSDIPLKAIPFIPVSKIPAVMKTEASSSGVSPDEARGSALKHRQTKKAPPAASSDSAAAFKKLKFSPLKVTADVRKSASSVIKAKKTGLPVIFLYPPKSSFIASTANIAAMYLKPPLPNAGIK